MTRMLMVCAEPPWPTTDGGRVRMARVAELLSDDFDLTIAYPGAGLPLDRGRPKFDLRPLPDTVPVQGLDRLRLRPRTGLSALGHGLSELKDILDEVSPDVVVWSHSYLAAIGGAVVPERVVQVCDFANIEHLRYRSLAGSGRLRNRLSACVEAIKASVWERVVARRLYLCIAISPADLSVLSAWGAHAVLLGNGMESRVVGESPDAHSILAVGNWEYGPNAVSMRQFLARDWPDLVALAPHARMVIVGKGSREVWETTGRASGVEALGYIEDLDPLYADAALVLAPANSGGGSQLKVADALSRGRVVIGPPYLMRELRPGMPDGAIVASRQLAPDIFRRWRDVAARRLVEAGIREYVGERSWAAEYTDLRSRLLDGRNRERREIDG